MRYNNELKVGTAIVVCAVIFFLGIRYFRDLPLFRGTSTYFTEFSNASGLLPGNAVQVNGVRVGSVDQVQLTPEANQVRVRFHVDEGIVMREGASASVGGLSALGNVYLGIELGAPGRPPLEPGSLVPGRGDGAVGGLLDRAPGLVGQVDTVLLGATRTFDEASEALDRAGVLLGSPNSELNLALANLRSATASLDRLLRAEQEQLHGVLANLETFSGGLSRFTEESGDTLGMVVQNLNVTLQRLNQNLASLETTTAGLDTIVASIQRGDGTLGQLVNDASLYLKLDSAATNLNRILAGFEQDPARYLRELTLVDLF